MLPGPRRSPTCTLPNARLNDVVVLDLEGRLTLGDGAELLRDKVASVVFQGNSKVILNLAGVPYIDSGGLGELVRCSMAAKKANGSVKLIGVTGKRRRFAHNYQADHRVRHATTPSRQALASFMATV